MTASRAVVPGGARTVLGRVAADTYAGTPRVRNRHARRVHQPEADALAIRRADARSRLGSAAHASAAAAT